MRVHITWALQRPGARSLSQQQTRTSSASVSLGAPLLLCSRTATRAAAGREQALRRQKMAHVMMSGWVERCNAILMARQREGPGLVSPTRMVRYSLWAARATRSPTLRRGLPLPRQLQQHQQLATDSQAALTGHVVLKATSRQQPAAAPAFPLRACSAVQPRLQLLASPLPDVVAGRWAARTSHAFE